QTVEARKSRGRRGWRTAAVYTVLLAGGLVMMAPFLWMVAASLKTRAEVFGTAPFELPSGVHLENYATMWNALPFAAFFTNSVKLALLSTVGQLVSCSMAGFAFAVLEFRGRRVLFGLLLA